MNKNLTIIDLDIVLNYLYKNGDTYTNIRTIKTDLPRLLKSLDAILAKLKADNLLIESHISVKEVFSEMIEQSVIREHIKLSFEGMLLVESGGYEKAEKRKSISTSLQSWQTWAIVVGTVMGGLYGLFELVKGIVKLCI